MVTTPGKRSRRSAWSSVVFPAPEAPVRTSVDGDCVATERRKLATGETSVKARSESARVFRPPRSGEHFWGWLRRVQMDHVTSVGRRRRDQLRLAVHGSSPIRHIRALRTDNAWTLEEMAERCDLDLKHLQKIESGQPSSPAGGAERSPSRTQRERATATAALVRSALPASLHAPSSNGRAAGRLG